MSLDEIQSLELTEGAVRVAAECEHGGRPCLVEAASERAGAAPRWRLIIFYACNEQCGGEMMVDFEPERVVDTRGRRLPWAWRS